MRTLPKYLLLVAGFISPSALYAQDLGSEFDGVWVGKLTGGGLCGEANIRIEVNGRRLKGGEIAGLRPNGEFSRGTISSQDAINNEGQVAFLLANKWNGLLLFDSVKASISGQAQTPNCGHRNIEGIKAK